LLCLITDSSYIIEVAAWNRKYDNTGETFDDVKESIIEISRKIGRYIESDSLNTEKLPKQSSEELVDLYPDRSIESVEVSDEEIPNSTVDDSNNATQEEIN
jgi:hypothetical protein